MKQKSENLVWIDLEMTGLNVDSDTIIEIATIVTDDKLNIVAEGPRLVIHQPDAVLDNMNEWCITHHANSGLTQEVKESTTTMHEAEEKTLAFLKEHCIENTSPLCGNSVHFDRIFLQKYMPKIVEFLHYRILDVTTIKRLKRMWYPSVPFPSKKEAHRALDDIKESIDELKYYKEKLFK